MKLGSQGLEVSMHGLHSMVLQSQNDMIALIHHAIESGVTFLDTSDVYGPHTNELLLGKVHSHSFSFFGHCSFMSSSFLAMHIYDMIL